MSLVELIKNCSMLPMVAIENMELDLSESENVSCCQSATARLLAAAQVITSIIALPIILLFGLLSAAIQACFGREGAGDEALKEMIDALKHHVISAIPVSVVGIFATLETTRLFSEAQTERLNQSIGKSDDEDGQVYNLAERSIQASNEAPRPTRQEYELDL